MMIILYFFSEIKVFLFLCPYGSYGVNSPTLFTRNYELHNHYTRQSQSLHTAVGRNEAIYKTFTFHGIRIWNYVSTKISVDVSYASFKHSSKLFIKNNPIPYRVT